MMEQKQWDKSKTIIASAAGLLISLAQIVFVLNNIDPMGPVAVAIVTAITSVASIWGRMVAQAEISPDPVLPGDGDPLDQ